MMEKNLLKKIYKRLFKFIVPKENKNMTVTLFYNLFEFTGITHNER